MAVHSRKRLFSIEEYHQMAEAGILAEGDRVELIEGEIVEMNPIGNRHAACVRRLLDFLGERLRSRALLDVQDPVVLGDRSEPQPDLALLRRRPDYYASRLPGPDDILLVVEVADTSAAYDRNVKIPLDARAGLREAWLVDLPNGTVEVYREPAENGYRTLLRLHRGESLAPEAFPDASLPVDAILG